MIPIEQCGRACDELFISEKTGKPTKLSKTNSFTVAGRIIYIKKKWFDNSSSSFYVAYDYKTRLQLIWGKTKEEVKTFLEKQDLGVLSEVDT